MEQLPRSPNAARKMIRNRLWKAPTASLAPGYVQANLVVLPSEDAEDFECLCTQNPQALPLLERTARGSPVPRRTAPSADLRTDVPLYRVYCDGKLQGEREDLLAAWRPDWVGFLLGCSFTFDAALTSAGIPVRHLECGTNVPMYITNRLLHSCGKLSGSLIVSMRPLAPEQLDRVRMITERLPLAHGGPIHVGDPQVLGVELEAPDFGDPVPLRSGEVPAFWACGVSAQTVALHSRLRLMVTHAPGHMFITDWKLDDLRQLPGGTRQTKTIG